MVDPTAVTIYDRTDYELEEFMLFCLLVAGKRALTIADSLERILVDCTEIYGEKSPFEIFRCLVNDGILEETLKSYGIGCFTRKAEYAENLVSSEIDLRRAKVEDFESIKGIGPKSARYFILHSRIDAGNIAVLDRHILRWLNSIGYMVPSSTPNSVVYNKIEKIFVAEARKRNISIAELDLKIWNESHK